MTSKIIHIRDVDPHETSLLSHLIRKAYRDVAERFNIYRSWLL
jgi:hypothetical protein